ncbi:MAG: Acyltransferase 3 [Rhodocyclales bacterium]|nr:Acyltransferase 3 [Rhodocyclales bacterium]
MFHAFPALLPGGFVGVDIFFVISGFLISSLIISQLRDDSFHISDFYARRIRRIFPALAVVLTVVIVFAWFVSFADEYRQIGKHVLGGAGFVSNLLFWKEAGYFDVSADLKPLLHLWSLGVEEQFYIIFPLTVWAAHHYKQRLFVVIFSVFICSFLANIAMAHASPTADFFSPISRMWELAVGAALSQVFVRKVDGEYSSALIAISGIGLEIMSVAGLGVIIAAMIIFSSAGVFPGWRASLPVVGAVLLIGAGPSALINKYVLSNRVLVWIGLLSFPLYLWHWPILSFLRVLSGNEPSAKVKLLAVVVSLLLAFLTYRFVEQPLRFGSSHRRNTLGLCVWMLVLGGTGASIFILHGVRERSANSSAEALEELRDPLRVMRSDGSCGMLFGLHQETNETCLARSAQPEILIMGDSHAMALNSAAQFGRASLNSAVLAGYSCLPFLKYVPDECQKISRAALSLVANTPSIHTVLLVNIGGNSYTDRTFIREDGVRIVSRLAMTDAYSDLIGRLMALNKRVIFVLAVPGMVIEPRRCFAARSFFASDRKPEDCVLPLATLNSQYIEYRQMVNSLAVNFPKMEVFDATKSFCDDKGCAAVKGKKILYFDTNHLSLSGSEIVLNDFSAWFRARGGTLADRLPEPIDFSLLVNDAPEFDSQGHWGRGYGLARLSSGGVRVGPGSNNPNVFAQRFTTQPNMQYKIVARAASMTGAALARIQVNWEAADGHFLAVSSQNNSVMVEPERFEFLVTAPPKAISGTLYVVPGGGEPVRYFEMRLLARSMDVSTASLAKSQ